MLLFALSQWFSESYNLELFGNAELLDWHEQYALRDFLKITLNLILLGVTIHFLRHTKESYYLLKALLCFIPAIVGLILNQVLLLIATQITIAIWMGVSKKREASNYTPIYYLFILLCILNLTKSLYIGI